VLVLRRARGRELFGLLKRSGGYDMTSWKCSNCGYTLEADAPPEQCPSCGEICDFINVSCYIPECDTGGGVDERL